MRSDRLSRGVRGAGFAAVVAIAAGCGGGGDSGGAGWLTFWSTIATTTAQPATTLVGDTFVPAGTGCRWYAGPWAPPGCQCDAVENARVDWVNLTTGAAASGQGQIQLSPSGPSCVPSAWWRAPDIPLAAGANLIEVRIVDAATSASGRITITRN